MQYIAVEVEKEEFEAVEDTARSEVNSWLDYNVGEYGGGWSDWAVVGGRYDDYPILTYSNDTACEFLSALDKIDKRQLDQFNEYYGEFDFPTINSVMAKFSKGEDVEYPEIYQANVNSLSSALKILRGYWNWDSGFFDIKNGVCQTKYLRKDILDNIDNPDNPVVYCLVPVDFHF